jgi:hypothetical protein
MPLSGKAIRLKNYVDDVAAALRRVLPTIPLLSVDERARVADVPFVHSNPLVSAMLSTTETQLPVSP